MTLTERHGKRFDFTIGNGSARVELESFSGTIRLTRPGAHSGRQGNDEKDADHEN